MAMPTEKPSFGTLDGVKVVYAAVELACPKACDLMADWGADVTWLENTGAGDTIRDTAYIKQAERRNQRSVALNYFSEEGKEVFFKMIKDADIFLEASKGGTWARKGITDEVLWAINPKLVIVHISGFGQEGDPKMVKRAAYDLTVMAYSGLIMQNGTEDIPEDTSGLWLSNPHADEIQKAFEDYCLEHSKYEIEEDFAAHRIAAQVVLDMEDLVKEEHLALRNTWVDWKTADGDTFHGLGVFPKFKNNPGEIWRPMPHQGGDTVDVLTKLGYTEDQINELLEAGVVKAS